MTNDEADGAALTMREALARHREDPACAGCHYDMDAIGFALENFDATGRWRDWDSAAGAEIESERRDVVGQGLDVLDRAVLRPCPGRHRTGALYPHHVSPGTKRINPSGR